MINENSVNPSGLATLTHLPCRGGIGGTLL